MFIFEKARASSRSPNQQRTSRSHSLTHLHGKTRPRSCSVFHVLTALILAELDTTSGMVPTIGVAIATMDAPSFVTLTMSEEDNSSALRSCFGSSSSSVSLHSNASNGSRRVRLKEAIKSYDPPAALKECLANKEERQLLWYTGNDIRRMKQSCVSVIMRIDRDQPVPQAVESDWQDGTTSTRGLEFGTLEGKHRMRAAKQFQRIVLEEQARLEEEDQDSLPPQEKSAILAAASQQASQPSIHRALDTAVQDADFVCQYIENSPHGSLTTPTQRSGIQPIAFVRRIILAARQRRVFVKANRQTAICCDGRLRCDTESTATLMAQSS